MYYSIETMWWSHLK